MRILYFNIMNGKCVPSYTCLPSHRAFISGSKIHSIETSYAASNIYHKGYDWFRESVKEENYDWSKRHPHLLASLKKLALKESLKHPFKYSNFKQVNPRFPFVLVWNNDNSVSEDGQ
ncbi:hypothetical protein NSS71_08125 [Niallia sp. FSL W8-0951]|uniref:hypothetical protein n=1 Tax=Niallia sp. FSL W8-0951 TaxID=2954639 RepID=UPI0030F86DE1